MSQRPAESWDREYKSLQAKDNKDNQNTKEKTSKDIFSVAMANTLLICYIVKDTLEKPKKQMQPLRRLPSTLSESDYYVEPLIRKRKKDGA